MNNLTVNRDKIKMCGDLVYHYQYYGESKFNNSYTAINNDFQTQKGYLRGNNLKIWEYKKYIARCDDIMRSNYMLLEKQGLPLCLGDIFVLSPEQFGVISISEERLLASKRRFRDLVYTNFGINCQEEDFPLFLTLTYKKPEFSPFKTKQDLMLFIKRLRYHLGINFRYIAVPEKHQSEKTQLHRFGSYHYHILLFDIPYNKIKSKKEMRLFQNNITDVWGKGFSFLKKTYGSPQSVAGYLTKYLTKDLSIDCGRRYLASFNCWKPYETDDLSTVPPLEFITSSSYTLLSGELMKLSINKIHHFKK
ncbi:MAG: hypothetical protein E6R13_10270 [Spirochaetes bacterium]|nr:MAG: hypothetical protein E6R13_10270 [Spirochaetota bacterium]